MVKKSCRRSDEALACNKLLDYLASEGHVVVEDSDHVDKPDLVINIDGKKVGCELTEITVGKLKEWHKHKDSIQLASQEKYELVVPIEPHMWIQRSLQDKARKYESYFDNTDISECWLLLHCGDVMGEWFIPFDEEILFIFRFYTSAMNVPFTKVFFLNCNESIYELKKQSWGDFRLLPKLFQCIRKGWRTRVLTIVQLAPVEPILYDLDTLPIKEKVYLPYLAPNVFHGDPDAPKYLRPPG